MYGIKDKKFAESLITDTELMLGIFINIHDRMGIFRHADGEPLFVRNVHPCPYCQSGRTISSNWEAYCQRDCHYESDKIANRDQQPFTKSCWKGVFDIVVPVVDGSNVPAVIYASGFRSEIPDKSLLPGKYLKMHGQLRDIPDAPTIARYTRTVWQLGQSLLTYAKSINVSEDEESGRKRNITRFIRQNAHQQIKLEDLAKELYLSPSRTRHLVIELFGRSFKHLLISERMLRARTLLTASNLPLQDICYNVGFTNIYYFNGAFKKYFGIPPGQYRRSRIKE
jgi:AraC-like DNA-binding protein